MVWRQILNAWIGGRNFLSIVLGYVKIHAFLDLWGGKMSFFDSFMRYDIVNYTDFCSTAGWFFEALKMQFFI